MSAVVNARTMNDDHTSIEKLMEEVDRYLAAVDLFRSLDCMPVWRPEDAHDAALPSSEAALDPTPLDLHLH